MTDPGPVELHSADPLADLTDAPGSLLDLTLDQLRTIVVVRHTGTALRAARRLGREQSSVQKQINALNDIAQRLVGELLVIKQGRGQNLLFTPTGEQWSNSPNARSIPGSPERRPHAEGLAAP